jgi:hypothetical protein
MCQIFFVSLCCDHSEDGDRVYSSLPYGLVLSKHISRLEYTLCDNPLVEPVSDLTTDNTKIHTIPIIHKYIIPPLTNLINIVIMSC